MGTNVHVQQDLRIVRAEPGDRDAVLQLYRHLHSHDDPLDPIAADKAWQQIQQDPNHHLLLGKLAGRPVASCALVIVPNLTRGCRPYALIENVVTHTDFRRRGIGKAMLHHAMHLAWSASCYKVMLLTGHRDQATLRFYEDAGFLPGVKSGFIAYPPAVPTPPSPPSES